MSIDRQDGDKPNSESPQEGKKLKNEFSRRLLASNLFFNSVFVDPTVETPTEPRAEEKPSKKFYGSIPEEPLHNTNIFEKISKGLKAIPPEASPKFDATKNPPLEGSADLSSFFLSKLPLLFPMDIPFEPNIGRRRFEYSEPLEFRYFEPRSIPEPEMTAAMEALIKQLSSSVREAEREDRSPSAIARLKANPGQFTAIFSSKVGLLQEFFADKGFSSGAGRQMAQIGVLGSLFSNLVLREDEEAVATQANSIFIAGMGRMRTASPIMNRIAEPKYTGTSEENVEVDKAIAESTQKKDSRRKFSGRGATRFFRLKLGMDQREAIRDFVKDVPVVVIGGGPAGLMVTREMVELGFDPTNITVLDKTGEYRGIWNQKNVAGGSKNNPFQFDFEELTLDAAPGSGATVTEFLEGIEDPNGSKFARRLPKIVKATVLAVNPGDLEHTVTYRTADGERTITAPIVINAVGIGKPLSPSRENHMTTDTPQEAGIRWQQVLTPERAEKYRGKTLIFIGLGNSTAEMLVQLRELNKQGYNIDYRVITHYPLEAINNPEQEVETDGRKYKVFRDIKAPNLVKWEGDLPDAREAYVEALEGNKIVSDVTAWHLEDRRFTITNSEGLQETFDCEQLFTLIGYGQDPEVLRAMGMTVTDEYLGTIAYDYDGEIQAQPGLKGRERLYPGYFALGAALKSRENPNAVVMPGIMHRMYDLLFTAAMRAGEYRTKKQIEEMISRLNLPGSHSLPLLPFTFLDELSSYRRST